MHTAERYHDISCGHRVYGHESKCAHFHGHNYRIHFVCEADIQDPFAVSRGLDKLGRVIDFSEIKTRLCMWLEHSWDHKFLMWREDPDGAVLASLDPDGVVLLDFNPTAENMAQFLVTFIGPQQLHGTGIRLVSCRIEETRKCSATYRVK